ncbi:hypothetical protein FOMPIDRAFT_1054186 [Fomitopsis schrenkii]|uniref:Uncharacterized protein n=1 Tax=Fomitopsis schrenkii TaxID=2126942 RepID=S8F0V6_FOMSC|nr:hypothetical protein FOMPIDRAFT_1054186 [Fomitopsis schrenkii]
MTWLSILRDLFYTMMGANVPQVTSTSTERVGLSTIKSTTNPSDAERERKEEGRVRAQIGAQYPCRCRREDQYDPDIEQYERDTVAMEVAGSVGFGFGFGHMHSVEEGMVVMSASSAWAEYRRNQS